MKTTEFNQDSSNAIDNLNATFRQIAGHLGNCNWTMVLNKYPDGSRVFQLTVLPDAAEPAIELLS